MAKPLRKAWQLHSHWVQLVLVLLLAVVLLTMMLLHSMELLSREQPGDMGASQWALLPVVRRHCVWLTILGAPVRLRGLAA